MERSARKSHPLRTILFILLAILFLILAFPFIYDLIGGFNNYDDIPALIASDGGRALSIDNDGIISFSANKSAVYSYAAGEQFSDQLRDRLSDLPFVSEKTLEIKRFGYSLDGEVLSASMKMKLFGFLPVQLHADAEIRFSPETLELKLTKLTYGRWIAVPLEKYAESFDLPELTDGFSIDTSDFYGELYPLSITSGNDMLFFRCDLLNRTIQNTGESGALLAELMPLCLNADPDAAKVLRGEGVPVYGRISNSSGLSELLTGILQLGPAENAAIFKDSLEDTPFLSLKLGDVSSTFTEEISEALADYERGLSDLREAYKEMQFRITKDGFAAGDGSAAESSLPEDMGAKIVLQYNRDYTSIVKANDGKYSVGLNKWIILPNPVLSDLKKDRGVSLPKVSGITVFDLTVACRLMNGQPAILFLTATDELGLNVISEELYEEILSGGPLPCFCSADIISPRQFCFVPSEDTQRELVLYLP